jgi:hypothetical protein
MQLEYDMGETFFKTTASAFVNNSYPNGKDTSNELRNRVFLCTSEKNNEMGKLMIGIVYVSTNGDVATVSVYLYDINTFELIRQVLGAYTSTRDNGTTRNGVFLASRTYMIQGNVEKIQELNELTFYNLPASDLKSSKSGGKKRSIKNVKKRKSDRKGMSNKKNKNTIKHKKSFSLKIRKGKVNK